MSRGPRHSLPWTVANGAMTKPDTIQAAISVSQVSQRPPKSRSAARLAIHMTRYANQAMFFGASHSGRKRHSAINAPSSARRLQLTGMRGYYNPASMIRNDIDWRSLRDPYRAAKPFPHVVIDDFFEPAIA